MGSRSLLHCSKRTSSVLYLSLPHAGYAQTLIVVPGPPQNKSSVASPDEYVERTAVAKGREVAGRIADHWRGHRDLLVISADTVVVSPTGAILEKPADEAAAVAMLTSLSGLGHTVLTGLALRHHGVHGVTEAVASETTIVRFAELDPADIEHYAKSGEPFDKAGGYGIQGVAGSFVERLEGDYFNVVGFPQHRFCLELKRLFDRVAQKAAGARSSAGSGAAAVVATDDSAVRRARPQQPYKVVDERRGTAGERELLVLWGVNTPPAAAVWIAAAELDLASPAVARWEAEKREAALCGRTSPAKVLAQRLGPGGGLELRVLRNSADDLADAVWIPLNLLESASPAVVAWFEAVAAAANGTTTGTGGLGTAPAGRTLRGDATAGLSDAFADGPTMTTARAMRFHIGERHPPLPGERVQSPLHPECHGEISLLGLQSRKHDGLNPARKPARPPGSGGSAAATEAAKKRDEAQRRKRMRSASAVIEGGAIDGQHSPKAATVASPGQGVRRPGREGSESRAAGDSPIARSTPKRGAANRTLDSPAEKGNAASAVVSPRRRRQEKLAAVAAAASRQMQALLARSPRKALTRVGGGPVARSQEDADGGTG